jgi:hypothetical protein
MTKGRATLFPQHDLAKSGGARAVAPDLAKLGQVT